MIKKLIDKVASKSAFTSPRIIVCYPSGVTEVERRAIEEATRNAGAREVVLMEEPMAAAIGAGLPVGEPTGSMIVDIGGGTTEVAIISLGGIVTSKSLRVAGDELDQSIIAYVKKEFNLMIGERTAEDIKMQLGSAYKIDDENESLEIKGRDTVSYTHLQKFIKEVSLMNSEKREESTMGELLKDFDVKRIKSGDILKGIVIDADEKEVRVNINYAFDGVISREELTNADASPLEVVKPGDEIDVYVLSPNDGEGYVQLSRVRALQITEKEELEEAYKNNKTIKVVVKEEIKGGLACLLYTSRCV